MPARAGFRALCHVEQQTVHGDRVFHLTPRKVGKAPFHLFYLHGGAFSIDIGFVHWQFIESLIRLTGLQGAGAALSAGARAPA